MLTKIFRLGCLYFIAVVFTGCSDVTPQISVFKSLDDFSFKSSFVVSADLSSIPLQASCSRFIEQVDVSFDGGNTWTSSSTYDSSSQSCSTTGKYSVTLSNSKAPWNTQSFSNGQILAVKFRARTRTGSLVTRDVSVKYTPSATIRQEMLVGAGTVRGTGIILKGRARAQQQKVAVSFGNSLILLGRVLQ